MRISGVTYVSRKTHKTMNSLIALGIIVLITIITVSTISLIVGWKLIHPLKESIPAFSSNIVPEHKDVMFYDINKVVSLKGWLFETKGSDKTIILAHGYGKNRLQFGEQSLEMIKDFLAKNYNVLTFDFRNSGLSAGKTTTFGFYEKDDLLGAIKFIKSQGPKHIVLMGFSEGASSSLIAACENKEVEAVIADTAFSDLREYLDSELSVTKNLPSFPFGQTVTMSIELIAGINPDNVSPRRVISKLSPRPLLLIHSNIDENIPLSNSKELYKIYSKSAGDILELWETKATGASGTYKQSPVEYMDRVLKFLDKVYPKK